MDKTLYTLIVHSENIAGLLNQITALIEEAETLRLSRLLLCLPAGRLI